MRPLLGQAIDSLSAVVFPTNCPLCGEELTRAGWRRICGSCWQSIERLTGPICACCGIPFASSVIDPGADYMCGPCRRKEYSFDLARSYGLYAGTLRAAVLELKFRRRERWAGALGALLVALWPAIVARLTAMPVLVPVPLHPSREHERGFNQAELLARGFKRKLGRSAGTLVPVLDTRCLRRIRATLPQSGLGHRARLENVRHGFSAQPNRVRDRCVLLVDDVMTTGATASACAHTLKRAGALQVIMLTLARATPQFPDGVVPLDGEH
jgi:ComF family protein